MSRSLTLGNGSTLVCFDRYGQVKDFYFPYAGSENHIGEDCVNRIGVSIDGNFSWLDDPRWDIRIDYFEHSMSSNISVTNVNAEMSFEFRDVVYNEKDIFLRQIIVHNDSTRDRSIRFFFNQQFHIYGTSRGDTAYFEPDRNILVHYEGRRVFVISGMTEKKCFDDYSVGILGDDGKEGTWKDAEDSRLEKNPVEHGKVDSVMSMAVVVKPKCSKKMHYWITAAKEFKEAVALHDYVLHKTPQHLIETTRDFWKAWIDKTHMDFDGLDENLIDLYKKSLLIIRSHVGSNGSIIAAGDSDMPRGGRDTYAYVWPRDAAFIALALDKAGYSDTSRKFFEFCNDVISNEGYFFHKYRPDKSLGSSWHPWIKNGKKQLAIQEDETALVIYALWQHYEKCLDLEFIETIYNTLIKKAADFMCGYVDEETGLPMGSYDIWEEKFGTATFTASSVYAGLSAAGNFAKLLGKQRDEKKYSSVAKRMRESIIEQLYDEKKNFFFRNIELEGGKNSLNDTLDMSSFLGVFRFGIFDADDKRLREMYRMVEDKFYVKNNIGGIIRYKGDRYFQVDDYNSENPWFITTLWGAQYCIANAKNREGLKDAVQYLNWVLNYAQSSGVLSEQLNRNTGQQLSVAPLIWSHAEFVLTVLQYLEKSKEFGMLDG
jgi:oligosaccharide amylase